VPWMMAIAPVISIATAVLTLAVIPFGAPGAFGGEVALAGIDVSIGLLYFFAFGSIAFYGLMLGGWASGSKYSFLGSMRAAAQLVSYEVAIGLSLLGVAMTAGSLSLVDIVEAQGDVWFVVPQIVGFLAFMVAGFAEASRPPFDLPEADAELVAGYNTEFGGMRFGTFFMAEYMEVVVISGIASAVFLGGWHGPGPEWLGPLWVLLKMLALIFLFIWVRATLPRFRYDQLMSFGWKVLLPLATVNVVVTAIVVVLV
jgi:NADH-quinone oxidoreductase subunit H